MRGGGGGAEKMPGLEKRLSFDISPAQKNAKLFRHRCNFDPDDFANGRGWFWPTQRQITVHKKMNLHFS